MKTISEEYLTNPENFALEALHFFEPKGLDKKKLHLLLSEQNNSASNNVKHNIGSLLKDKTYAVVTGQQLGLYGGPLYTFYKILNTVQICKKLREKHAGYTFVPVFWLEGEDADFEEVSSVHRMNGNAVETIRYEDTNSGAIGNRTFNDGISEFNDMLRIENSPFRTGTNWALAFYDYFKPLFDQHGIIAFHPNREDVREVVSPFYKRFIETYGPFKNAVISQGQKYLNQGFKLQVDVNENESFLFEHSQHDRQKIKAVTEDILTKKLSPNVMLRPLLQDYIFPTIVYIGGNAEISYQLQLKEAYNVLGLRQPMLFPRTHVTLLNQKAQKLTKHYHINYSTIDTFKQSKSKAFESQKTTELESIQSSFLNQFNSYYTKLESLEFADKTMIEKVLESSKTRQVKGFEQLMGKIQSMLNRLDEDKLKHFEFLESILFPFGKPQERIFPTLQFSQNLLELAELFLEEIDILNSDWQFLTLR